jgi:hypothetical protein
MAALRDEYVIFDNSNYLWKAESILLDPVSND